MKAVVCQNAELSVQELPDPIPEKGNLLLKVLRCGICGSDLHVRHHCNHMGKLLQRTQYMNFPNADEPVVFGHEFCGEILDHGPRTQSKLKPGTRVCAVPLLRRDDRIDMIGLSATSPGAYAERIVVQEALMEPIPNGLSDDLAALTEPMAVALHAVRRSEIRRGEVAIVIGCGPVGLAVIAMLKARGVQTIVASDYSPARRALATRCGADLVIDPAIDSPYTATPKAGFITGLPQLLELAVGTREKLGRLPIASRSSLHAAVRGVARLFARPDARRRQQALAAIDSVDLRLEQTLAIETLDDVDRQALQRGRSALHLLRGLLLDEQSHAALSPRERTVLDAVPEAHAVLPPTAIGKDYLGPLTFVASAPSGSGWQASLWGLAGVTVARAAGLELNLLGLGFGVDINDARLRLPGLGLWPRSEPLRATGSAARPGPGLRRLRPAGARSSVRSAAQHHQAPGAF